MNHGPRNSKPVKRPSGQSGAAHKSPVRKGQITHARKPGSKKTRRAFSTPVKVLLGALVTVALTCLIVGITMLDYMIAFTHGDPAINLDEYKANQNQTTIVYAYDKNQQPVEVTRLHGTENRIWVNLSQMPEEMKQSVIAIEDKRFEKHNGVDWFRTASAIVKHGMSQGGSTITQQLIKNLTGDKDVTIVRKFREILYALNLERNYSKDEILEAYLNTIYLGEGCYGVKTAAEKYFGKDVSELNLAECTALLGITQYPYKYDPLVNPENNKARQKYGLDVLLEEGTISQKEYDEAIAYSLVFTNSKEYKAAHKDDKKAAESESKIQSYYVDYVVDQVIDDLMEQYGLTEQQATQKVYYGGLKIYTAMDPDVQSSMENVFYNRKTVANKGVQAAMTVMDYKGRVVGVVGGLGEKQQNRGLNRAVSSKRQPGSSIKPLSIYAPAIENNLYNWSSMIADSPSRYVDGKPWPVNYGQKVGDGQLHPLQYAVERSLNTVPARMLEKITIKTSFDFLENHFHLSTLEKSDADWAPLVTGAFTQGVTTLDMAAAYAAIGNGGTYYEPYCYYKVTNSSGSETLLQTSVKGEKVLSPDTADVVCELLQANTNYGTTKAAAVSGFQTMAKTGTTTDEKDRWFAAGTPYYVSATWYGYDTPKTIYLDSNYNPSAKLFKAVFDPIHKNLAPKEFGKSGLTVEKEYCKKTGLLASPSCTSKAKGWYKITDTPAVCTSCGGSGLLNNIADNVSNAIGQAGDVVSNAIDYAGQVVENALNGITP